MLVLYALVAICGYYYFGWGAHELVTADLKSNSPISGVSLVISGLTVDKLVSAFILCNAFTTYPNLLLVIQVSSFSLLTKNTVYARRECGHPQRAPMLVLNV